MYIFIYVCVCVFYKGITQKCVCVRKGERVGRLNFQKSVGPPLQLSISFWEYIVESFASRVAHHFGIRCVCLTPCQHWF